MLKFIFSFFLFIICLLKPSICLAFDTSDPSVSFLQNRISNNFSREYCKAIQNGFSKDEAMKTAIVKTENIISFSYNPQKKWIEKSDLANQISLQVVNDCGRSIGLIFSVKSPERKIIDSPIIWKDDYSNISLFRSNKINSEIERII